MSAPARGAKGDARIARPAPGPPGPGDLGRRVARRRRELDLTHQDLARRTGMSVGYLEAVERRPAHPTTGAVLLLAAALNTTAAALLGGDAQPASGRGPASAGPRLETLHPSAARRLLGTNGVGRVVLDTDERGPVAIPVNYRIVDGEIVFRTATNSTLDRAADTLVGFEVDRLDDAFAQGWSVLATGWLARVTNPSHVRRLTELGAAPWAGGDRPVVLHLDPTELTGRRIAAPA